MAIDAARDTLYLLMRTDAASSIFVGSWGENPSVYASAYAETDAHRLFALQLSNGMPLWGVVVLQLQDDDSFASIAVADSGSVIVGGSVDKWAWYTDSLNAPFFSTPALGLNFFDTNVGRAAFLQIQVG